MVGIDRSRLNIKRYFSFLTFPIFLIALVNSYSLLATFVVESVVRRYLLLFDMSNILIT
jgi:hypothetical protein